MDSWKEGKLKERLDKLLVSLNYFDTERAKKAIMAGLVQVNDQVKDKRRRSGWHWGDDSG